MDNRSNAQSYFSRPWNVLGILMLISASGGCIGRESVLWLTTQNRTPSQDVSEYNLAQVQSESLNVSEPDSNKMHLILRHNELNRTGKLPVTLKIMNPRMNETVLTVFRPEFGSEWYNKTSVTYIASHNWTQNFSIKRLGNTSYVLMFVQISENNTVVKKAAWNITFDTPIGRPK